jgi:ABC-2 type transport system permease protein
MRSSVQDIELQLRFSCGYPAPAIGASPVNDATPKPLSTQWVRSAPGEQVLKGVNWGGLKTLYIKEVRRFFKVQMQTVWAPAITTLLYLAIFTVALGRSGRTIPGLHVRFADFIAPGLIVMAMMQNAFANASFSLLVGKIQGNIVDYLMPPLSTGELMAGLIGAAVTRAFLVGFAVWLAMLLWPGVSVDIRRPELVFWFGLMGALMLSFLGLLTSLWADKFDHAAAVTNFVVTPLSLLSGTFYSIHQLAPAFQKVSQANPFFYVISGFRAGFLGISDSPPMVGAIGLLVLNVILWAICFSLLKCGWKIKN